MRQKGSYRKVGVNLVVVLQGPLRSQAHQSRTTIHSQDDTKLEAGILSKGNGQRENHCGPTET